MEPAGHDNRIAVIQPRNEAQAEIRFKTTNGVNVVFLPLSEGMAAEVVQGIPMGGRPDSQTEIVLGKGIAYFPDYTKTYGNNPGFSFTPCLLKMGDAPDQTFEMIMVGAPAHSAFPKMTPVYKADAMAMWRDRKKGDRELEDIGCWMPPNQLELLKTILDALESTDNPMRLYGEFNSHMDFAAEMSAKMLGESDRVSDAHRSMRLTTPMGEEVEMVIGTKGDMKTYG